MKYLLHDVFSESVQRNPQNIAIKEESGKCISYNELEELSHRFAQLLQLMKPNIRSNPYVGILSPVHIHSIAAVLGTLQIGAAYVPLDAYSPSDRLLRIVENTKLDVVCVDPAYYEKHHKLLSSPLIRNVILLDEHKSKMGVEGLTHFFEVLTQPALPPKDLNQVSDDLAYVLHTSGSTGVPKGIMLTHRNARTFVDWMQKEFQLTPQDIVMSRAPFKFDLSVFDVFNTFKAGAKLICFDWNKQRKAEDKHIAYVRLMEQEEATMLYTTPSTFITLMNRGQLAHHNLALRQIMYAGEPFPVPQLRKLMENLPNVKVANIYGPTETNIITYYLIKEPPKTDTPIPLGHVVDDTEIIVVSDDGDRICSPNEVGELWCRGGTVTLGYLGMEDKTREHRLLSPFHPYPCIFWRTGDYGFWDEEGLLHYRGRQDHMVKVKGYRIELGEVESVLAQHNALDEFCIVAVPDAKYGNRLFCYYSLLEGKFVDDEDLRDFLAYRLPDYMVPYRFVQRDYLPKTSSGKVDRVALQEVSATPVL